MGGRLARANRLGSLDGSKILRCKKKKKMDEWLCEPKYADSFSTRRSAVRRTVSVPRHLVRSEPPVAIPWEKGMVWCADRW